ncbi:MAG: VOC family protein [Chitinophagales bacterium]
MNNLTFNKIKETAIYVKDLAKTKNFYHHKLGLPIKSEVAGRHIFFTAGSSILLCFLEGSTDNNDGPIPPHWGKGELHFAFESSYADYDKWKKKIQELGIEIEKEMEWRRGLKSFYFRDPDGHSLEIVMDGIWDY